MVNKTISNIAAIIFILSLLANAWFIFLAKCDSETIVVDSIVSDTQWIVKDSLVYLPSEDTIIYDTINDTIYIDTSSYEEIIKDYFATRIYDDTLKDDTIAFIRVRDQVNQNRLTKRSYWFTPRFHIIHEKIYISQPPKYEIYLGGDIMSFNGTYTLFGGIVLKDKKNGLWALRFNPMDDFYSFGYYTKIKYRK